MMASPTVSLDEELQCFKCKDWFGFGEKLPRLLHCGHTFCHSCIEDILTNDEKKCPICCDRLRFNLVDRLSVNVNVQNLSILWQKQIFIQTKEKFKTQVSEAEVSLEEHLQSLENSLKDLKSDTKDSDTKIDKLKLELETTEEDSRNLKSKQEENNEQLAKTCTKLDVIKNSIIPTLSATEDDQNTEETRRILDILQSLFNQLELQ